MHGHDCFGPAQNPAAFGRGHLQRDIDQLGRRRNSTSVDALLITRAKCLCVALISRALLRNRCTRSGCGKSTKTVHGELTNFSEKCKVLGMANTPCEAKMNRIQGSYTAFSLALGVHAIEEIYSHYYAESPSFHAVKMWLGFWHLPAIVFAIIQILVIGGLIWYYRWLQRGKGLRVLMACLFLLLITELEHDYLRFSEE